MAPSMVQPRSSRRPRARCARSPAEASGPISMPSTFIGRTLRRRSEPLIDVVATDTLTISALDSSGATSSCERTSRSEDHGPAVVGEANTADRRADGSRPAQRIARGAAQPAAAPLAGVNATDWECLDVLDWIGPITAGELARRVGSHVRGGHRGDRSARVGSDSSTPRRSQRSAQGHRRLADHATSSAHSPNSRPLVESFDALDAELGEINERLRRRPARSDPRLADREQRRRSSDRSTACAARRAAAT